MKSSNIIYSDTKAKIILINRLTPHHICVIINPMTKDDKYKSLEISGPELDSFIKKLADRLYNQIWSDMAIGPNEVIIKDCLKKSIIQALKEYAEFRTDG
ncbi:MAG: hypothetical protein GY839_20920 [candidate division Zixibacteria bacterium]|nr:hypothetical protein [candidate division Zixibacteria bacterium]